MPYKKVLAAIIFLSVIAFSAIVVILPTFLDSNQNRVAVDHSFKLEKILDTERDIELIFFGYAGCVDVCTPRLEALGVWYRDLDPTLKEAFNVRFIDISQNANQEVVESFAQLFHEDFIGVALDSLSLREYTKPFTVYFAPSLSDSSKIDHSAHLYMVQKKHDGTKAIRFIYTIFPFDGAQLIKDIEVLINE